MIPTRIGQEIHGGTFTGFNRVRNQIYGIIAAPVSTTVSMAQSTCNVITLGAQSTVDGAANTAATVDVSYLAAHYCKNLTVNEFADWYLPSKNELELVYRNLKPSSSKNYATRAGVNPSSVPTGLPYTGSSPAQTIVLAHVYNFVDDVDALLNGWYWTSTASPTRTYLSLMQQFSDGLQGWYNTSNVGKVRSVRRVLVASK